MAELRKDLFFIVKDKILGKYIWKFLGSYFHFYIIAGKNGKGVLKVYEIVKLIANSRIQERLAV